MTFLCYSDDGAKILSCRKLAEIPIKLRGVITLATGKVYVRFPALGTRKWQQINREDVPKYAQLVSKEGNSDLPLGLPIPIDIQDDVYVLAAYEQMKMHVNYDTHLREGRAVVYERLRRESERYFSMLAENARLSINVLLFFITGSRGWCLVEGQWTLDELNLECGVIRRLVKERIILPVKGKAVFWNGLSTKEAVDLLVHKIAVMQPKVLSDLVTDINSRSIRLPTKTELLMKHQISGMVSKMRNGLQKRKRSSDGYNIAQFRLPACLEALCVLNYQARLVLANHVLWLRHSHVDRFVSAEEYLARVFSGKDAKKIGPHSRKDFISVVARDAEMNKLPMVKSCYSIRNGKDANLTCPFASNGACTRALGKKESTDFALTPIKVAVLEMDD